MSSKDTWDHNYGISDCRVAYLTWYSVSGLPVTNENGHSRIANCHGVSRRSFVDCSDSFGILDGLNLAPWSAGSLTPRAEVLAR